MNKISLLLLVSIITILGSCATKVPMNQSFFSDKKVGIMVSVDSISTLKAGSQGLLDMAISSGRKYKEALQYASTIVKPKEAFQEVITNNLSAKNKPFIIVDDKINFTEFAKFSKSEDSSNNKYYKHDLRSLKDKYGVDEMIIVNIKYGLQISYYGMIETGKAGNVIVYTDVVNLNDNSIYYKDYDQSLVNLKGKWDVSPDYKNLTTTIQAAVDDVLTKYKTKY